MLLGVLPAILPQSSAHAAASAYLADEIGNTEITVDVDEEFCVVLYVADITRVAGYECKITVSGPATPIGSAVHGDWFAGGHTVFDGIDPAPAGYNTAMLLSPAAISGSGAVVAFTLHADEEGSLAINVDPEYFLFATSSGNVIELDLPSTLYVTVLEGDGLRGGSGESELFQESELLDGSEEPFSLKVETVFPLRGAVGSVWVIVYDEDGETPLWWWDDRYMPFERPEVETGAYVVLLADDRLIEYGDYSLVFRCWLSNGIEYPDLNDADLEDCLIPVDRPLTYVQAVYEREPSEWRWLTLTTDEPELTFEINEEEVGEGDHIYPLTTSITLDLTSMSDLFDHWESTGMELPYPQVCPTTFDLTSDVTITPFFKKMLTVQSIGKAQVLITADPETIGEETVGGYTDYQCGPFPYGQTVTLTVEDTDRFSHWRVNDDDRVRWLSVAQIVLDSDTVAVAMYTTDLYVYDPDEEPNPLPGWFSTIQAAVTAANSGDVITVLPGTYTGPGNRDIDCQEKILTIQSSDPSHPEYTIIDGESGADRGFNIHNSFSVVITGFTIKNFHSTVQGGAIYCTESSVGLSYCVIQDCSATMGAGVFVYTETRQSSLSISSVEFARNAAQSSGGAIYCKRQGGYGGSLSVAIAFASIHHCSGSGNGGGAYCFNATSLTITDCVVEDNSVAQNGQGDSFGGGIAGSGCANISIERSRLARNATADDGHGGGIWLENMQSDYTLLRRLFITGNVAHRGGGIDVFCGNADNLNRIVSIQSSCIVGNSNGDQEYELGGGMAVINYTARIVNCTITENRIVHDGRAGGGIYLLGSGTEQAPSTIANCIIAGNSAYAGRQIALGPPSLPWNPPTYLEIHYSCVPNAQDGNDVYIAPGNVVDWYGLRITEPPRFVRAGAWNGGNFTLGDYHLEYRSPCLDAGDDNAQDLPPLDLDGQGRRNDGNFDGTVVVDIGAYERYGLPILGDANADCRVNILDLIFIRNKLNQAVGTGDNWQADVNCDGRINILDLIFVRGKLNTSCP